ncbi:hypothetical protein [Methylobacter sp. BlB1]|uniref:hypothetical protein n=1 Tax=Methylobacter sp. BlB1 TaxID=2785914 RepID=UPI001E2FA4F7|nr:hypothetical protein [Methylobacter sp. BlB1]
MVTAALLWLRLHREASQAHLPIYLGFFEFVHNARKRGKALLSSLLELIISYPLPESIMSLDFLPFSLKNRPHRRIRVFVSS